jgi:hypothetical protein
MSKYGHAVRRMVASGPGTLVIRPLTRQAKEKDMRFLGYTLGDPNTPMTPPSEEHMAEMNKFVEEATKAGVLLATGGIAPFDTTTKIVNKGGEISVLDGPFTEAKELIGGWALMEARDRAEALEWCKRFMALAGEGETRLREVFMP